MLENIIKSTREKCPLVHNITNYVTVNDCANILLAAGASPIMADDIDEVEEITSISGALVINIGTLNARTIKSMVKAGKKANELSKVAVLDPVGAGASVLRTDTTFKLLKDIKFSVIRGNFSEIKTIAVGEGTTKGVDADVSHRITEENIAEVIRFAKQLSEKTGSVIAMTGAIDIVASSNKAYIIRNGHPSMSKISGTGCMLSSLIAAYCAANPEQVLEAAAAAVSVMGLCGELAYKKLTEISGGISTYRTLIIDYMSKIDEETFLGGIKIEVK